MLDYITFVWVTEHADGATCIDDQHLGEECVL